MPAGCSSSADTGERRGRDTKGERRREEERERERKRWGLFELSELKSLSFFTIETDSYNMW